MFQNKVVVLFHLKWFWWFKKFSKLKVVNCEYWTPIKIKISMTRVSKEYKDETKMVQEQWLQLKMTLLFFYWVELGGRVVGRRSRGGKWANFWLVGGTLPHTPGRVNPVYTYILYITYIKELIHFNFARFKHSVCYRYLWYIFSLVCLLFVIQ